MSNENIEVLSKLEFLNEQMFSNLDYDLVLEGRDDSRFDEEWVRVHKYLWQLEKDGIIDTNIKVLIDELRERAFKVAYSLTSNSDISASVSDDMELIAKSYILNYHDKWLAKIIEMYKQSCFPYGDILKD